MSEERTPAQLEELEQKRNEAMRMAFQRVFGTTARTAEQRLVWAWLVRFCRKNQSTYEQNERDHVLREGRREVFVEIERRIIEPEPTVDQILKQLTGDNTDE
jgi:hypothetical protein